MWLSLAAFVMCVAIMFLLSWIMSLVTLFVVFALYLLVVYRKPGNVNLISGYSELIPECCRTKVFSVRLINNKICVTIPEAM